MVAGLEGSGRDHTGSPLLPQVYGGGCHPWCVLVALALLFWRK